MKIKLTLSLIAAAVTLQTVGVRAQANTGKLTVHEWGTFTSLQGGDGVLIPWKPLHTSELPKFVYNWSKPGLPLYYNDLTMMLIKGEVTSLQRMETPVVYFYSDREQTVDLKVNFPQGTITEWYPEASQVGPSALNISLVSGAPADFGQTKESLIRWSNLHITPAAQKGNSLPPLPADTAGTHYFAARATDADFVSSSFIGTNGAGTDFEKFLFYRGTGNFATPLRVSLQTDGRITVANTGKEPLANLFVLGINAKSGSFVQVSKLQPGEEKTVALLPQAQALNPSNLSKQISREVSQSLVSAGLYPREAEAMVNTWRDSWFTEDGVRVLYFLPRAWTDQTLPMTLSPAPSQLVRVMVGRAEVLPPVAEQSLALKLRAAKDGDPVAAEQARTLLKSFGRFAEPAFNRALAGTKFQPQEQSQLAALLSSARAIR